MKTAPKVFGIMTMVIWYFPIAEMFRVIGQNQPSPEGAYKILNMDLMSALCMFFYLILSFLNSPKNFCRDVFCPNFDEVSFEIKKLTPLIFLIMIAGLISPVIWIVLIIYWIVLLLIGGLPLFWKKMLISGGQSADSTS